MKLLTKTVEKSLPALYSQENTSDPQAVLHFFNPCGAGNWYITEGSWEGEPEKGNPGEDFIFFGLCEIGFGAELGYVALSELAAYKGPLGLGIERDLHWTPKPLSVIEEKVGV